MDSKNGRIVVFVGPVCSGKSEELIGFLRRAMIARQRFAVFKAATEIITTIAIETHSGETWEGGAIRIIAHASSIKEIPADITHIYIEDAHALRCGTKSLAGVCRELALSGYQVVVFGRDRDLAGRPIDQIAKLLGEAEEVYKLSAVCAECANDGRGDCLASHTQLLIDGQPATLEECIIQPGGHHLKEVPCCRHCHQVPGGNPMAGFADSVLPETTVLSPPE